MQKYEGDFLLPKMYDVKGWLDPVLKPLYNHSHPHLFKFVRDTDGNSLMLYKHWSDDMWLPQEGSGILLLQVIFIGCYNAPLINEVNGIGNAHWL